MELVSVIRHKVLTEGVPIRDVARQLGLSRNTIRRYVRAKVVPVPKPRSPTRATPARAQVADAAHGDASLGAAA
jgi:transposase